MKQIDLTHKGTIIETNTDFRASCQCGKKFKLRYFRYQSNVDLYDHYATVNEDFKL